MTRELRNPKLLRRRTCSPCLRSRLSHLEPSGGRKHRASNRRRPPTLPGHDALCTLHKASRRRTRRRRRRHRRRPSRYRCPGRFRFSVFFSCLPMSRPLVSCSCCIKATSPNLIYDYPYTIVLQASVPCCLSRPWQTHSPCTPHGQTKLRQDHDQKKFAVPDQGEAAWSFY